MTLFCFQIVKMFRRLLLALLIITSAATTASAQSPYFHYFQDSLLPGYRISGTFDSVDCKLGFYQTTSPNGWRPATMVYDPARLYRPQPIRFNRRYSAIPHVGLLFSMGSNASQYAGLSYTQSLTANSFIQLDYRRTFSNGAMRNSGFETNILQVDHLVRRTRYASQLQLVFDGESRFLNGGLLNDSLDPFFELAFQQVEKDNAQTKAQRFDVDWQNYFSFTLDSLIKTGIFISPEYSIGNRRFTESGEKGYVANTYGVVNYDSTFTADAWERTSIGGTAGYFFHSQVFAVNGGLRTIYWDYDNQLVKNDTTEISLTGNLVLQPLKNLKIEADAALNLAGAIGEKGVNARLSYRLTDWRFSALARFDQSYPMNYQRRYYANTLNYYWIDKQLITTTLVEGSISQTKFRIPAELRAGFRNVLNQPFFVGDSWVQNINTSITVFHADLRTRLTWKRLFVEPSVRYQEANTPFLPNWQLNMRLGFDGYLFASKKLRAAIGVDGGYTSTYRLYDYEPRLNTMIIPGTVAWYEAMPKLHAFTQFELGFMRWYIRFENLEQLFLHSDNHEVIGYPVLPMQFRFGLSWDLFN